MKNPENTMIYNSIKYLKEFETLLDSTNTLWKERYEYSVRVANLTREVNQTIKDAVKRGWTHNHNECGKHHKLYWPHAPKGQNLCVLPCTPSDPRSLLNTVTPMKKLESQYPAPVKEKKRVEDPLAGVAVYQFAPPTEQESRLQRVRERTRQRRNDF